MSDSDQAKHLNTIVVELANRCIAGDQSAMIELVERFRGQVYGLCFRMLGQREDAEDATQETFIRVLKSIVRWDQSRDFEPWLLAIAGNRCRTALAKRMKRPAMQVMVEQVPDTAPGDLQAARHLSEEVQLALLELRPEYREAFVLFHEQEMGYAEIAEAMDCPLGTVKTWVHRARREMIGFLRRRGVIEDSRDEVQPVSKPIRSIA